MPNLDLIFIFGAKYLPFVIVIFALAWFLIQPRPRQKEIFIFACICLPLIFIVSEIAGRLYDNPRPFVAGHFQPLIPCKATNGFPSHHTLLAAAFSAVVSCFSWRIGFLLWILTLLVGLSRVYVGVHHLIDIIASMLISASSAILTLKYLKSRKRPISKT